MAPFFKDTDMSKHLIKEVEPGSIADELNIEAGDELISVNGEDIEDLFDYQFMVEDEFVELIIKKKDGQEWDLEIEKDEDDDLGIIFEQGLMDDCRRCSNKCIFCFIDQMPPGMRDTLYFKDDDARLSFLQGNYITLTNMSDKDVDRIIKYNLSPVNISFQTTNPQLRCKMLNNRFAGEALNKAWRLVEAGMYINGQVVLCKGVNDGAELNRTLNDLYKCLPYIQSLSIVPVGLTKFRDGLYPMEPFTREDALSLIDEIKLWQDKAYEEFGTHFVHLSDEWYIMAGKEMPDEEQYDGYLQLSNGVGMIRSMLNEFEEAMLETRDCVMPEKISIITGKLAYPYIKMMADKIMNDYPQKEINVIEIRNDFFGEMITVSGLICSVDIIEQTKDIDLGDRVILPENMVNGEEYIFLDDMSVWELEEVLQVEISIVKSSGYDFVDCILERGYDE